MLDEPITAEGCGIGLQIEQHRSWLDRSGAEECNQELTADLAPVGLDNQTLGTWRLTQPVRDSVIVCLRFSHIWLLSLCS
jgi:hypothetical protein